ncbi:MAG: hypothetical protein IJF17_07660 [Thermoguttaceae bacterium]|nr:hypothetical protein [Thermoguttaceae bacterium]
MFGKFLLSFLISFFLLLLLIFAGIGISESIGHSKSLELSSTVSTDEPVPDEDISPEDNLPQEDAEKREIKSVSNSEMDTENSIETDEETTWTEAQQKKYVEIGFWLRDLPIMIIAAGVFIGIPISLIVGSLIFFYLAK